MSAVIRLTYTEAKSGDEMVERFTDIRTANERRFSLKLLKQGAEPGEHKPIVKLFAPWGAATWLISEIDPQDRDQWFGLADLGFGCPEMGWISISEITAARGPFGLKVERDRWFVADKTIVEYADEARASGEIAA